MDKPTEEPGWRGPRAWKAMGRAARLSGRANCFGRCATLQPVVRAPVVCRRPLSGWTSPTMSDPVVSPHPVLPDPGCLHASGKAGRLGPTHILILLIAVLVLGSGLLLLGIPLSSIFALLGGCGAIGTATLTAVGGGRRLVTALAETAVRSSAGK